MLKRLVNEARFTLKITTTGPLLIKSSHATVSGPDMTPVLTYRNGDWEAYLPGSSLKGVFRSHLEKVCRTLRPNPTVVCNPFWTLKDKATEDKKGQLVCDDYVQLACSDKFERRSKKEFKLTQTWQHVEDKIDTVTAYHESCPICRLFGSTEFTGRISINDAYAIKAKPRTEQRDGVGIDRLTGGSYPGALFNLEVVSVGTEFSTEIQLRNFEIWQLGMVLLAVQDMADGLMQVGSGKSRGLGSVKGEITAGVTINHIGQTPDRTPQQVWGLGRFLNDGSYGTQKQIIKTKTEVEEQDEIEEEGEIKKQIEIVEKGDILELIHLPQIEQRGIRQQAIFSGNSLVNLREQAIAQFIQRLDTWQVPPKMSDLAKLEFRL